MGEQQIQFMSVTYETSTPFLREEPLVPLAHFCKDTVVTPSTSLANSMSLPKAAKLAQLFVNILSWAWQEGEDQAFITKYIRIYDNGCD